MITDTMPQPQSARVVVIGGGIGGCSAAYHLAMLGVTDVLVLERSALSSGTTWHSTGNMETYRADPLVFEMVRYAASLYPRLAAESGQDIGWRNVGRVMYTDCEERWASMRTLPELGRARGIEIGLLTPADIARRLPIIAPDDLVGGIWVPSDARVNPTDAVMAFVACARARGVRIQQQARVLEILVRDGAVCGVETAAGTVECETIVLAAGLWSGDLARSCNLPLPLHALEHQYLITKPLGINRNLPLFLSYDDQLYGREEVGGIMVGSLDDHAVPLSTSQLPQNFSFALLSERWDQFEPYMATAMRRFPLLRNAGIKMLLNGPESFTPDGQMLLGPVPGGTGLFAACAFNSNGMALAPAAGRFIAEWIVEGAPSADVAPLDVRRFSRAQAADAYIRERVTEIPGYHCRMHPADADYETARDVRRSPLHASLAERGARFASVNAWERPLWVAGSPAAEGWLDAVAHEARAATDAVLVVDRSADAKHLLTGPSASAWLAEHVTLAGIATGPVARTALLPGSWGEIEALGRAFFQDDEHCLLMAGPEQEMRLSEWLRRADLPPGVTATEVTAGYAVLALSGPGRGALLLKLAPAGTGSAQDRWVGSVPVAVCEDPVCDTTLAIIPANGAVHVWRRLLDLGETSGLRVGGHFAEEAIRIRRGVPGFGREATPARLIRQLTSPGSGLVSPSKFRAAPRTHKDCILAAFSSPLPLHGFGGREVVLRGERTAGELTSRVRLPDWPSTLALALMDPHEWHGEPVELVADGARWPLTPRTTDWSGVRERQYAPNTGPTR